MSKNVPFDDSLTSAMLFLQTDKFTGNVFLQGDVAQAVEELKEICRGGKFVSTVYLEEKIERIFGDLQRRGTNG